MKKLIVVFLLICCSVGLLYILLSRGQQNKISAAEFLPENVLFYAEHQDFASIYKEYKESRLGRIIADINFSEVSRELGAPDEQILVVESFLKKINEFMAGPAFNELLGKEFSVALFPAKSFSAENPARALEERLLLIARPRHNAQFLQLLFPLLGDGIEQRTVQYGGHVITRYHTENALTISTVTVRGLVIVAIDERLLRKSLDCYDEKSKTLYKNAEFRQLRKRLKLSKLFTYVSIPALYEQGKIISEKLPDQERKEFLSLLEQWKGWGGAAYGAWKGDEFFQEKALIHFDIKVLDPRIVKLLSVDPSPNNTLAMVPQDVLFYYWTNTLNLPLLWEIYSSILVKHSGDMDLLHQEIRDVTGVEFEDILDMVSKEIAILIQDIDSNGIPLPKAALIVKLEKPEEFFTVFDKLLVAADIPISTKEYKKTRISYWGIAPQAGLQPAFTFQEDYFVISNSIDVIKQIVDLKMNSGTSFLQNSDVQEVAANLSLDNNSAAYVDIATLADAFKDFALWAGSMASLQGPEAAHSSKIVVEQIVLPLLDGVAMYSKLGSRSLIEDDTIVLESKISIIQ